MLVIYRLTITVLDNHLWTEFTKGHTRPRQLRASVFPLSLSSPAEMNLEVVYSDGMAGRGLPNLLLTLPEWEINICWVKLLRFTDLSIVAASVYYSDNLCNLSCLPMVLNYCHTPPTPRPPPPSSNSEAIYAPILISALNTQFFSRRKLKINQSIWFRSERLKKACYHKIYFCLFSLFLLTSNQSIF